MDMKWIMGAISSGSLLFGITEGGAAETKERLTMPPTVYPGRLPYERPKTIEMDRKSMALPEPKAAAVDDANNTVFIAGELKGVILIKTQGELVLDAPVTHGVVVKDIPLLQNTNFNNALQRFLGKPVRLSTLQEMEREVWLYSRSRGYPLVSAVVPAGQNFANDVVQMVVIEGTISDISVKNEGKEWFASSQIRGEVRQSVGSRLDARQLETDLDWLNRNPFRTVSPAIRPGDKFGETKLSLEVEDRIPLRGYAGYEDTGTQLLGVERFVAGANYGNLFDLDHQLNYQYSTDLRFSRVHAHSANYVIPLPWRHTLSILGSYVDVNSVRRGVSGEGTNQFATRNNIDGENIVTSARYTVPLPSLGKYKHEISAGFDFKRIETLAVFSTGGTNRVSPFQSEMDVVQFEFGYSGAWADKYGYSGISLEGYYSPGGIGDRNSDRSFFETRTDTDSSYYYLLLSLNRTTQLPHDFSWVFEFQAQFANERLTPSEQFGVGGYSSVRGYDERVASGDEGQLLRNELRLPPFKLGSVGGRSTQLQLLGFVDVGGATTIDPVGSDRKHVTLVSAGAGLRFNAGKNFSLRADYGFQLDQGERGNDGERIRNADATLNSSSSRAHIGAILSF